MGAVSPDLAAATARLSATILTSWSDLRVTFSPSYPDLSSTSLKYLTNGCVTALLFIAIAQKAFLSSS